MKPVLLILTFFFNTYAHAHTITVQNIELLSSQVASANPGDTLFVKAGVYTNATIKFINTNGTLSKPIYVLAQKAGQVFFEGNSTLSFAGNYIIVSGFVWQNGGEGLGSKSVIEFKVGDQKANHCQLTNCAIINYNACYSTNSKEDQDNKWVSIYGQYNTVSYCLLQQKKNRGATLTVWLTPGQPAHHTISYNYFLNRQNGPEADNGLESMRIGDSKTSFEQGQCVVAFNRFEQCDGEIEIISNKSFNNSYLHNTFYNSNGGLTLRHGNNCLCDGNYFDGCKKPLSYGIRFIGEGHAAINNYFINLGGAPNQTFRAPVTVVNGLVNTPINGYFQPRRSVITANVFVNNALPNIRIGAFSKREGMTLAPDTLSITNNIFFENTNNSGDVYEELTKPMHLNIANNQIAGNGINANKAGFAAIKQKGIKLEDVLVKDAQGHTLSSVKAKATLTQNADAGANWVAPNIAKAVAAAKFTFMAASHVGPLWMH